MAKKSIAGSDRDSYAMAYSLIEWMVKTQPKRFRKLLELIKKGTPAKAALERALGMNVRQVEGEWRRYVKAQY